MQLANGTTNEAPPPGLMHAVALATLRMDYLHKVPGTEPL
jgi:hypothetical protein